MEETFDNNPFDAPVPGQGLTDKPGNYPWEHPPQYTDTMEASEYIWDKLTHPSFVKQVIAMLDAGIPVEAIARIVVFAGFTEGKWSPDTMMLLMEPVMYTLMNFAETAVIDYIIDSENNEDEDEAKITKDDITTLDQIQNVVLRKDMDFSVVPNEIKEEIQQTVPSILSRKQ